MGADTLPLAWQLGVAGLLGLAVGSFLNVLVLRLPRHMRAEFEAFCAELAGRDEPAPPSRRWFGLDFLIRPGSHCPRCGHAIGPLENLPVLGWLLLRGRCKACRQPISVRYPLVELLTAALTVAVVWRFGTGAHGLAVTVLVWGLIALAFIDLDEQLLPDVLTLPLLWLGLLVNLDGDPVPLRDAVIGAVAGYLTLWTVFQLFRLLTGKEGMGHGDFKLLSLFGAWLGWQMLPQILLLSALGGALAGGLLIALRLHRREQPLPFGPWLILGGLVALFFGEAINDAYLRFSGLA